MKLEAFIPTDKLLSIGGPGMPPQTPELIPAPKPFIPVGRQTPEKMIDKPVISSAPSLVPGVPKRGLMLDIIPGSAGVLPAVGNFEKGFQQPSAPPGIGSLFGSGIPVRKLEDTIRGATMIHRPSRAPFDTGAGRSKPLDFLRALFAGLYRR